MGRLGKQDMSRLKQLLSGGLAILALAGAAACEARPATSETLEDVCRPAGLEAATLGIGDITVPHHKLVAQLHRSDIGGDYGISVRLAEEYAVELSRLTRENIGVPLALRLDDITIAEPVVQMPILDGRILISGNFTRAEASEIVARLSRPCPTASPQAQ